MRRLLAILLAGCLSFGAASARAAEPPPPPAAPPAASASPPEAAAAPAATPGVAERIKQYQANITEASKQAQQAQAQLDAARQAIAANRGAIEEAAHNLPAEVQP